jgi:predicted nucleotidyltransferase
MGLSGTVEGMRGFRDRDFLQTNEGFFFCVVGAVHPPERVISYIKYVPSESGVCGRDKTRFSRILQKYTIPNLLETFNYLETNFPHYLFHSPVDNITITAVPHQHIKEHFKPEKKLAQLRQAPQLDALQQKLVRFTRFLEETASLSECSFGVTGSLLLDIHQPTFSDLDVIVYGVKDSWALKKALTDKGGCGVTMRRLEGKALEAWGVKKSQEYPLTAKEALKLYERKWNLGFFEDRWVSIHPVKLESEVKEEYGEKTYTPCGQVTIEALVSGNVDSLFLPATYQIEEVKFLDGRPSLNVTEVVTYESLYDSLAETGEVIRVKGKLERVTKKGTGREHYRVLVGSPEGKGTEYIKLVE